MRRFFHHDSEEQKAAREREQDDAARSLSSLEAGGLPLRAQERLAGQAATGGRAALWTSDLSVGEFLATRALRFEPLGQVLGASIYHIAYNVMRSGQSHDGELTTFSQALYDARDRALGRMREEASLLGAHGVVGVRIEQKEYEWGANLLEFMAIGTAVRLPGAAPLPQPFLCDLSGQEALTLFRAGYVPVTIAVGCCAYYVVTTWDDERQMHGWGSWANTEMARFTQPIYGARHSAMNNMAATARAIGAEGIVGSDVRLRVHVVRVSRRPPWSNDYETIEDHVVEFVATGTAIAAIGEVHEPAAAALVLDLGNPQALKLDLAPGTTLETE